MATHFDWYKDSKGVVPWNAQYSFPSQANKITKVTVRIPPKNGGIFYPGNVIRVEFPAQDFVNPLNTTFEFDVTLVGWTTPGTEQTRIQNNIQSIFQRVRLLYGATPLEDILNYNMVVRLLTEYTSTNQTGQLDQTSISEGIGGTTIGTDGVNRGSINVRQNYIQGLNSAGAPTTAANFTGGQSVGTVPVNVSASGYQPPAGANYCTRRYQVNLALGLLTQDKLIPTQYMAAQLAIEITLEQPSTCIYSKQGTASGSPPTYVISNFNMVSELLGFDTDYEREFVKGLEDGGVPVKFSSWHTFTYSTGGASFFNLPVNERSRSVKALFAVQTRSPSLITTDSHSTFFDTALGNSTATTMQNYQWRIGGRYFPAQPVQLSTNMGTSFSNGGSEAFVELQKALNVIGDYRICTSVNTNRWALPPGKIGSTSVLNENDYDLDIVSMNAGIPTYVTVQSNTSGSINSFSGNLGSSCYCSAIDLETSNGIEISGLNAEEQSDIYFIANFSNPQSIGFNITIFSFYDAMLILEANNGLKLVQ